MSRRLDAALAALEREREAIAKVLHELERSNKGADVMAAEVKRLKVQKLRLKDGRRRRKATQFAAEARAPARAPSGASSWAATSTAAETSQSRWRTRAARKTPPWKDPDPHPSTRARWRAWNVS